MKKRIANLFEKNIGRWFEKAKDKRINDAINIENVRNMHTFSIVVIFIEMASMILYGITNRKSSDVIQTLLHVGICVAVCFVVAAASQIMINEYKKNGTISDIKSNMTVDLFYLILSIWGAYGDIRHYINGEQMLTFYIVQICFLCLVVMVPKVGIVLILFSFAYLYGGMYMFDGAVKMQLTNFIIFAVIAIFGNAIQYMIMCEAEKNKLEILDLNRILQQEASVDDLTKLMNRFALTRDMNKFVGKTVYVTMADIDYFKRYNDNYGHLVGDKVLGLVASTIKASFGDETSYRYGGDEFLIIQTDCTEAEYKTKISEWKKNIQSINVPGTPAVVTCSSGYGSGIAWNADEFKEIIKEADDRLYEAKKAR